MYKGLVVALEDEVQRNNQAAARLLRKYRMYSFDALTYTLSGVTSVVEKLTLAIHKDSVNMLSVEPPSKSNKSATHVFFLINPGPKKRR